MFGAIAPYAMTQQYLVGQFSVLLGDLRPPPGKWLIAVAELRREVERSPPSILPRLAHEAIDFTDMICWAALEEGDATSFRDCAKSATALREFADYARFLGDGM